MSKPNPYCEVLGIDVPRLEVAKDHPDANYYSLLIVALLECGEPITLEETAQRFEEAGVASLARSLASLKRCKPARPPIYRDGDLYALDPHDDEADLWAFRLGLRPHKKYGRLHGTVRLRWGFLDEMLPAPWIHRDEPTLYNLKEQALERDIPLEVVAGSAPGWSDPWSRGQLAFVEKEPGGWRSWIVDEGGFLIDESEIQRARLADSAQGPG